MLPSVSATEETVVVVSFHPMMTTFRLPAVCTLGMVTETVVKALPVAVVAL